MAYVPVEAPSDISNGPRTCDCQFALGSQVQQVYFPYVQADARWICSVCEREMCEHVPVSIQQRIAEAC